MKPGALELNMPCVRLIALIGALFGATLAAQGPPRPVRPPGSVSIQGGDQVVSPVAMATWVARVGSDGTRVLQMLVLWRGSPGWFARGSGSGASGGGDGRRYRSTIRRGEVQLQVEFDSQTQLATIQGKQVDSPLGVEETMRRSQEIRSFLRCDTRPDDPLAQKMSELVCARVLGQ